MNYLIIGAIVALTGIGLMGLGNSLLKLLGAIVFLIGMAIVLKGRRKLDKNR